MSIITKQGDKGKTRLLSGELVSKSHGRIETYGILDELVAFLGFARSLCKNEKTSGYILNEQKRMSVLCCELATKSETNISLEPIKGKDIDEIEEVINYYLEEVEIPKSFVIPGENTPSSAIEICRTVCRRLERKMVELAESGEWKNDCALIYINRLSDLLYLMARMEEGK